MCYFAWCRISRSLIFFPKLNPWAARRELIALGSLFVCSAHSIGAEKGCKNQHHQSSHSTAAAVDDYYTQKKKMGGYVEGKR